MSPLAPLLALACLLVATAAAVDQPSPFPAFDASLLRHIPTPSSLPHSVFRISHTSRSLDAQLLLFTLQGALARTGLNASGADFPLLYKTTGAANTCTDGTWTYWQYYARKYGGRVQFVDSYADSSVEDILPHFAHVMSGYY